MDSSIKSTRIRSVKVLPLQAKLTIPFRTAPGQHTILDNVLFSIELENKIIGFGEAGIAAHLTGETVPQTFQNLKQAAKELIGLDVFNYISISGKYFDKWQANMSALAALETALLDALTKTLKIPLWKLFGVKASRLKSDITIVLGTFEEAGFFARKAYLKGYRVFKIKVGRDEDEDIKRVIAVQKAAPRASIYIDANQGFKAEEALGFLKKVRKAGIEPLLLEQPVKRDDWDGLSKVTREGKITVVADESASSVQDVLKLILEKRVSAINIKTMKFGILGAVRATQIGRAANLKLMIGGMMETDLAVTASAHLASGMGGFDFVDLDAPTFLAEKVMDRSYCSSKGEYNLSSIKAGIGVSPQKETI